MFEARHNDQKRPLGALGSRRAGDISKGQKALGPPEWRRVARRSMAQRRPERRSDDPMTPALAIVVRDRGDVYRFRLGERSPPSIGNDLKMNFENSPDAVCITSDEGDALVPGTEARAAAELEANATGKPVTIRNPVTDEVLATVRPALRRRNSPLRLDAALPRRSAQG